MEPELILNKADWVEQWREMLAADPQVKPPRLTAPREPEKEPTAAEVSHLLAGLEGKVLR